MAKMINLQRKVQELRLSVDNALTGNGVIDHNPVAVVGALLSFLDQHKELADAEEERCAGLVLLAENVAEIPRGILKLKHGAILAILLSILELDSDCSATVRSAVRCLEKCLGALDAASWKEPMPRAAFERLTLLALDERANVRKAAHQAFRSILAHPPPPQQFHPMAKLAGMSLTKVIDGASEEGDMILILQLLRWICFFLPENVIVAVVDAIYPLASRGMPQVTRAVFQVFGAIFEREVSVLAENKLAMLVDAVRQVRPHAEDVTVAEPWLAAISQGMAGLARANAALAASRLHQIVAEVFPFLESSGKTVKVAAEAIRFMVRHCVTAQLVQQALTTVQAHNGVPASQRELRADLERIITTCELGLSIRYKDAWPQVLLILAGLVCRLGPAAEILMRGTLELLGDFRDEPEFPHKQELDEFLRSAIKYMGPRKFLEVLPLNIEKAGKEDVRVRTYLLPLMADSVERTELAFFTEQFVPLANYLKSRAADYVTKDRQVEAKVHEALYLQVWSLLPGFCVYPTDLKEAFRTVGPHMGNVLRDQAELRPLVCSALTNLIVKNKEIAAMKENPEQVPQELAEIGFTPEVGATNLRGVAVSAKFFLPLLFNIFKGMAPDARSYVGTLIGEFVEIADVEVVSTLYNQIMTSLQQPNLAPELQDALLDLAILLLPRLPVVAVNSLFQLVLQGLGSAHQKKCYKILAKMAAMENGRAVLRSKLDVLESRVISEESLKTEGGARKDRLRFLCSVVDNLLAADSALIQALLPEAMESIKEVNHVCRAAASDLIVKLGKRMLDALEDVPMSGDHGIDRFIKLIAAGLVAQTPHFVSATIYVLALVCFEFKDLISDALFTGMFKSVVLLTKMPSREVAKSIFQFLKVSSTVFPATTIAPHLVEILATALHLGDAYGSEFRVPTRHLMQRLVRQFDLDTVEAATPIEHHKLIANIRKRAERAKRRKEAEEESDDEDLAGSNVNDVSAHGQRSFRNAFDDIVYGDSSDSEVEESGRAPRQGKGARAQGAGLLLHEGDNMPVDFLDRRLVGNVLGNKPRRSSQLQSKRKAKLEGQVRADAGGRLIINSDDEGEAEGAAGAPGKAGEDIFDYYLESVKSKDGFTRVGRKIKFSQADLVKNTMQGMDWDADDAAAKSGAAAAGRTGQRTSTARGLGMEYRAKKAGGDIKRAGMPDPYAYIPLTAKIVGNRHKSVQLTGKSSMNRVMGRKIKKHKK